MDKPLRLWAISDVHIDSEENHRLLQNLCDSSYQHDMLIIAGDVTDNLGKLLSFLKAMQQKFQTVAFVLGNHELWLRKSEHKCSIDKFDAILSACNSLGIVTHPIRFGQPDNAIWVVPLFSWYEGPEDGDTSLFVAKHGVQDATENMWRDYFLTRWPQGLQHSVAEHFLAINDKNLRTQFDAPIVSFSHFLPRSELMFRQAEAAHVSRLNTSDPNPEFNFSRVAGTWRLDDQIRTINSEVHIYGHQHRNRTRVIEGITYLSHCMGYPSERQSGHLLESAEHPRIIWQSDTGFSL